MNAVRPREALLLAILLLNAVTLRGVSADLASPGSIASSPKHGFILAQFCPMAGREPTYRVDFEKRGKGEKVEYVSSKFEVRRVFLDLRPHTHNYSIYKTEFDAKSSDRSRLLAGVLLMRVKPGDYKLGRIHFETRINPFTVRHSTYKPDQEFTVKAGEVVYLGSFCYRPPDYRYGFNAPDALVLLDNLDELLTVLESFKKGYRDAISPRIVKATSVKP